MSQGLRSALSLEVTLNHKTQTLGLSEKETEEVLLFYQDHTAETAAEGQSQAFRLLCAVCGTEGRGPGPLYGGGVDWAGRHFVPTPWRHKLRWAQNTKVGIRVGPWGRKRAEWGIEGGEHVSMDFGNRRYLIACPPRHGSSHPQGKPQLFTLKPYMAHIHPKSSALCAATAV